MNNETFAYFRVINHTNQLGVSSYALPFCIYKFAIDLSTIEQNGVLSNKQILWDYGDGTTGGSLTGRHAYTNPGTYRITCFLYDNDGNAYLNTYSRNVVVSNYITDAISLSTTNTEAYNLTAGRIEQPILIGRTNSYQSYYDGISYSIVPFASGSNLSLSYYDGASALLYGHLEKYNAFYIEQDTPSGETELVETNIINVPSTKIYCKLQDGEVIHTTEDDEYAFFCGTSGEQIIYFKDDVSYASDIRSFQVTLTSSYSYPFNFVQVLSPTEFQIGSTYYSEVSGSLISLEYAPIQPPGETYYSWKISFNPPFNPEAPAFSQTMFSVGFPYSEIGLPPWSAQWNNNDPAPQFILNDYHIPPINLYFGFQSDIFNINTSTIGLSCKIFPNTDYNVLSITSNGIDGEGSTITTFDLDSNKFIKQKINFVVKVKDSDWYTIKDLNYTNYTNTLSSASGPLNATFVIQSSANGYIKGYVIPYDAGENAFIYTTVNIGYQGTGSYGLSGSSATFDILSSTINLAKKGEDFDMLDNYKSLRFQELFLDKVNLFDNFLGTIVGTISSDQNTIGKKVYEKITNFVDNNSNIEKCEVSQLVSILQSVDEQNVLFEKVNFNYPTRLKRIIDLLSIKHSKLFGSRNTFDLDFYNYGNQLNGNNLGSRITDTLNYTISAGTNLVALEKYSGTFKKLDTYIPLSAASLSGLYASQYPLSSYDNDWGWYLVLNNDFQPSDFDKYYIFFNHTSYQNDIEESVINFKDGNTTIQHTASSYDDWKADNGTIDKIVNYELALGLGLILSLSS